MWYTGLRIRALVAAGDATAVAACHATVAQAMQVRRDGVQLRGFCHAHSPLTRTPHSTLAAPAQIAAESMDSMIVPPPESVLQAVSALIHRVCTVVELREPALACPQFKSIVTGVVAPYQSMSLSVQVGPFPSPHLPSPPPRTTLAFATPASPRIDARAPGPHCGGSYTGVAGPRQPSQGGLVERHWLWLPGRSSASPSVRRHCCGQLRPHAFTSQRGRVHGRPRLPCEAGAWAAGAHLHRVTHHVAAPGLHWRIRRCVPALSGSTTAMGSNAAVSVRLAQVIEKVRRSVSLVAAANACARSMDRAVLERVHAAYQVRRGRGPWWRRAPHTPHSSCALPVPGRHACGADVAPAVPEPGGGRWTSHERGIQGRRRQARAAQGSTHELRSAVAVCGPDCVRARHG